jgi:putative transcriptional regulator
MATTILSNSSPASAPFSQIQSTTPASAGRLPATIDAMAARSKTGLSRAAFARRIGVSVGTIRNWEQGRRSPQRQARGLLALLDPNPRIVEETLET